MFCALNCIIIKINISSGGVNMLEIINNIHLEMLLRLLIAAILGLLIGLEREFKKEIFRIKNNFSYIYSQLFINDCFYPVGLFITWFRFG